MSSGRGAISNSDVIAANTAGAKATVIRVPESPQAAAKRGPLTQIPGLNVDFIAKLEVPYKSVALTQNPEHFKHFCRALNEFRQAIAHNSEYKNLGLAILETLEDLRFEGPELLFNKFAKELVRKSAQPAQEFKLALIGLIKGAFARRMTDDLPFLLREEARIQAIECLCTFLRKDPDPKIRAAAARGLKTALVNADMGAYGNIILASWWLFERAPEVRAVARALRGRSFEL